MEFRYVTQPALESHTDLLAICVHQDASSDALVKAADRALEGALAAEMEAESFTGKSGQILHTYSRGALPAEQILLVGAGERGESNTADARDLAASAARVARRTSATTMTLVLPPTTARNLPHAVQFATEGTLLGSYRFARYLKSDAAKPSPLERIDIVSDRSTGGKKKKPKAAETRAIRAAIKRGEAVAAAVAHARDLVNEPAAVMTPSQMASEARALGRKHKNLTVKVLSAKDCEKLGMGMFLAVGQGSAHEPKLVHMVYKPARKPKKRVALIGKGVTFDSGGYSLKPSQAMEDMKIDMSGSAAVVAAMGAVAEIGSPYEVHAITALAENLVSGNAYKLGDVLHAMDGTTVEINNTDAEGRLTLGDAISYALEKIEPDEIFDFATLTGACVVALGPHTAGVLSDDDKLAKDWLKACESAGEDVWRLPLNSKLKDQLKSPIADLRNTGERWGGAITAALFLRHFTKDTPWVHTDIAGPATASREHGALTRGGTGFGVASMVEYLTA